MEELAIINKKTGEIIEERVLFIGKNPRYLDKGYVKIFTAFLSDIVETDEIAGKSIRLLLYMLKHLNYNTLEIQIIPSKVIKELDIKKDTYHRWIRDLIKFGIIEKKTDTHMF